MYGQSNRLEGAGETCDDGDPMPQNPFIADALDDSFPTSPDGNWVNAATLDPVAGMALILDTIANTANGVEAVLHVSPGLAAVWVARPHRAGWCREPTDSGWRASGARCARVRWRHPAGRHRHRTFDGHSPASSATADGGLRHGCSSATTWVTRATSRPWSIAATTTSRWSSSSSSPTSTDLPTVPRIPVGRDCSSLEIDWSDPRLSHPD